MVFRAAVGAIDEAVVDWQTRRQPYDITAVIDGFIELGVGAVHSAARLDPSLDVAEALVRARRS